MTERKTSSETWQTGRYLQAAIAILALAGIGLHLVIRFGWQPTAQALGFAAYEIPLIAVMIFGGVPLVLALLGKLFHGEFGSDLLAGISIVTSFLLGEYLAGVQYAARLGYP